MMASLFDFDALPSFRKGGTASSPHRRPSPSANASEFSSPTRTYSHENYATYQNYGKTSGTGPAAALYAAGSNGGRAKIDGAVVQQRFLDSPSPRKPLDPLANMGGGTTGGGLFSPFHRKVMAGDSKRGDEDGDLEDYQSAAPLTQPRLLAPPARAQAAGPMEAAPSADSYVRLEDIMNAPLFPPVLPSTAPVPAQARAQPSQARASTASSSSLPHAEEKGDRGRQSRSSSLEPPARGTAKPVAFRKSYDIVLGGTPGGSTAPPVSRGGGASTSQSNRRAGTANVKSEASALAGPGNGALLQSFRSRLAALAEEVEDLTYEVHTGHVSPRRDRDRAGSLPPPPRLSSLTLPAVPGVASPIAPLLPSYGRIRAPSTTAASLGSELPSLASPPNEAADAQDMPLLYGAAGAPQAVHAAIGAMFAEAHGMSSSAAGQDKGGVTRSSPSRQLPPTSSQFYQDSGNSANNRYTTSSHVHAGGGLASADMSDLRLRAAALIPVTMAQVASDIVTGKVWDRDGERDRGHDRGGGPSGGMTASPPRASGPSSFSSPSRAQPTSRAVWDRKGQSADKTVDRQSREKETASQAAALQAFQFEDTHARGFEEAGALLSTPMPGSRHAASSAVRASSRPQPRTAARAASVPALARDTSPARSPEQRAAGIAEQQAAAQAGKLPRYLAPTKARMESMSAQAALLAELSQRGEKDMRRHPPGSSSLGQGARRASIAGSSAERQVKLAQQRRSSLGALPTASSSGSHGQGQAVGKGGSTRGAALGTGRGAPRSTSVPPRAAEAGSQGQPALPPPVPTRVVRSDRERAVVTVRGRQPAGGTRSGSGTAVHSSASNHAPGARAAVLRRDSAASSLLQDAPRAMDLLRRMDAARKGMVGTVPAFSASQPSSPPPTLAGQRVQQSTRFAEGEGGVGGTGIVLSASPPDLSGREFIAHRLAAQVQQQTAESKGGSSTSPRPARSEQARSTVKKQRREASSSRAKSPSTRLAASPPPRTGSQRAGSSSSQGADEGKARLLSSLLLKALNGTGAAGEAALKSIHSGSVSPAVLTALLPLLDKLDETEGSMSKLRTRTAYLEALLRQLAEQTAKASASDQAALNGLHSLSTLQDLPGPFGHGLASGGGGKGSPVREAAEAASRAAADKAVLDIMNVGSSPYKAAGSTSHPDGMAYKDVLAAALSLSQAGANAGGSTGQVGEHGGDPIGRAMERVDAKFKEVDPYGQQSPRPASTSYAQAQARADAARANELGSTLSPLRNAADIRKALADARQAAETAAAYTRDMSSGGPVDEGDPLRAPIPSAASVLAGLGLDSEGRVSSSQGAALLDAAVQKHKLEQVQGKLKGGQPDVSQPLTGPAMMDALSKQAVAAARVAFGDSSSGIAAAKALVAAKLGKAEETLASSAAVMAKEAKASGHPSLEDMIGHLLPGYGGGLGGTAGSLPTMHGVIAGMVRESQLGQDADVRKALADAPFVSMRMPLPTAGPGQSTGASPSRVGAKASESGGRCAECETVTASRQCHECQDAFCDMCFTALHRKGARKEHLWTRVDERRGETEGAASPARPSTSVGPTTEKHAAAFMSPGTLAQFDIADPLALERMVQKAVSESGSAYLAATARTAEEMRKPLATSSSTSAASAATASNARPVDPHPMLSMPTVQLGPGLSSLSLDLFKRVYAASGGPEDMHKKAQLLTDAAKAREEAAALGIADPLSLALTIGQGGGLVLTSGGEADAVSTQLAQQAETAIAVAVGHATDRAKAGGLTLSADKDARSGSPGKASSNAASSAIPRPATPAVEVVAPTAAGSQQSVLTQAQLAQLSKSLLSGLDEAPANGRSRGAPSTSSSYRRIPSTAGTAQSRAARSAQRFLARMQAAAGKREAS